MEELTSLQNPKIKTWASLKERKYRAKHQCYLVEGMRSVEEYMSAGVPLDALLLDPFGHQPERLEELADRAEAAGIRTYELESHLLRHITDTEHPQGVVAVARLPNWGEADLDLDRGGSDLRRERGESGLRPERAGAGCRDVVMVADQVGDPGNLGTILRSADAVGARAVVALKGTTDPYQPKVVRAAMGALARVPVVEMGAADGLAALRALGYRLIGADARRGESLFTVDLTGAVAIVVGHETGGLSAEVVDALDEFLALPMPGGAESLNAGVAASVILYEALRRRS